MALPQWWVSVVLFIVGLGAGGSGANLFLSRLLSEIRGRLDEVSANPLKAEESVLQTLPNQLKSLRRRALALTLGGGGLAVVGASDYFSFLRWGVPAGVELLQFFGASAVGVGVGLSIRAISILPRISEMDGALTSVRSARTGILGSFGEEQYDATKLAEQARKTRDEERFRSNTGAPYQLRYLDVSQVGIFDALAWNFEPGVNVLLGRNGFGKSFLLRVLACMLAQDAERLAALAGRDRGRMSLQLLRGGDPATIECTGALFSQETGRIPLLSIPDSRFINRARTTVTAEGDDYSDLARYGSHHFLHDLPYETTINTALAQMCVEALDRPTRRKDAPPDTPQLSLVTTVFEELSGETFRFRRIEPTGSGARFSILIETDSSPGRPIPIQQASQGTLSVIAMCGLIYQFLRATHRDVEEKELCMQPAMVLIDELDAHLHPVWQGKVVHLLRKHFPKVQFIVTAHSPLVVAGCLKGEVAVLRRDSSRLRVVEYQRDFIGARPEEIYKEVFQIEERDPAFLDLQAQLPQLPQLKQELAALRSLPPSSQDEPRIRAVESTIASIVRTGDKTELERELEGLQRENEQLRRQLGAMRTGAAR